MIFLLSLCLLVAFASGFHCFLLHDRIFDSFMASILKTIGMLLGEVDIGDHFIHANEDTTTEIANPSAQIMLVMFIIYGVLIFMNLLLALVVNKMDPANFWIAEIIPTKQRIQDISSMTDIASLICRWYKVQTNLFSISLSFSLHHYQTQRRKKRLLWKIFFKVGIEISSKWHE